MTQAERRMEPAVLTAAREFIRKNGPFSKGQTAAILVRNLVEYIDALPQAKREVEHVARVLWDESGLGGVMFETQQRRFEVARAIVSALSALERGAVERELDEADSLIGQLLAITPVHPVAYPEYSNRDRAIANWQRRCVARHAGDITPPAIVAEEREEHPT